MTQDLSSCGIDRRALFALGAAAGVGALSSVSRINSAQADGLPFTPLTAKPLPEKVFTTVEAGISRKTHEEHYELYKGYVAKVNEIRAKLAALGAPDLARANATFSDMRELKVEYSFAHGGVTNHELFFNVIGGKGGDPTGPIADAIKAAFGSIDYWKADFRATALAARGWVWLAHDHADGSLFNYIGDAQNSFPVWNASPVLAIDVYEHAYFIDFGRARARYIDAFNKVIDWDAVNGNLKMAQTISVAVRATV